MIKLPISVDINNLIDDLRIFSWEAAEVLLYYSNQLRDSENRSKIIKNSNRIDPVTLADLKVDELITKRIMGKYQNIDWEILSEENIKISSKTINLKSEFLWILDPLDGTKDFIQGTENYAMHLALNHKQVPLLGVVLIPESDQLWITNGYKTWCEGRDGSILKTRISKKFRLDEMTIVTSKNHRNQSLENLIKKANFRKRIIMGSIGCKIASIIRGESDIYISLSLPESSSPKDWDFAAPEAILKAAGGALTNLDNQNLIYNRENFEQRGIIIASNNKEEHGKICSEIRAIITKFNLYPFS